MAWLLRGYVGHVPLVGDITGLLDGLRDLSGEPVFLLVIFAVALLDSVLPIVPSETVVIVGGVAAGAGDQSLPFVIAAGLLGAFAGDNLAYQLGRSAEGFLQRTVFRNATARRRLDWAAHQLDVRGGSLLVTARFIPGGRTAVTVASGLTEQPRRRFAAFVALAATIWATYASLLGYLGGSTFADDHVLAFGTAFALAVSGAVLIEIVRLLHARRTNGATAARGES